MEPLQILLLLISFGSYTAAADIDYDIQGNIYVVDRSGNMVVKYSPSGDSIRAVSGYGSGSLQFDEPVAIHARRGNEIYVVDYNNHRVQRFNRLLDYIGTIYTRDDPEESKRFGYPRDIAVTRQGDLLIVDGENRRVISIDPLGNLTRAFGDVNAGAGRLIDPREIETDENDNIYVLDEGEIVQFDPFGNYMQRIPPLLGGKIHTISIDRDTLLIADSTVMGLFDLRSMSTVSYYGLPSPAAALRWTGGRVVAVEGRRVAVYEPPQSKQSN